MTPKAVTLLKVLLNRYHQDAPQKAIDLLPKALAEAVTKNTTDSQDLSPILAKPEDLIKNVHYSWIKPIIDSQPKNLIPLYLSALPQVQSAKLAPLYGVKPEAISPPLKKFLMQKIYRALFDRKVNFSTYLPNSPFNALIHCSKAELLTLIDYLGLYDLAGAVRHIVDTRYIKQLNSCLTPRKQEFLRSVLHQKERLVSTPVDLNQWKGDCNEIKQILHNRGLIRFGIALSHQHPDFMWHLCHTLDIGRANLIQNCGNKEHSPEVVKALTQQLVHLMNFLKIKPS